MKRFFVYFKKYRFAAMAGPALLIIDVLAEIVQPVLMSKIVDIGINGQNIAYIVRTGLWMVGLALVALATNFGSVYFSSIASQGMGAELRLDLFSKIQEFSFANIDKFGSASLVTRLTNDVNTIQQTAMIVMRMLIRAPLTLIMATILAFTLNAKLALLLIVAMPVLTVTLIFIIGKGLPLFTKMQGDLDKLNEDVQENLTNVRVVKSFVTQKTEKRKFTAANDNLIGASIHAMNVVILTMPVMMLLMNFTIVLVMWFGGNLIGQGQMFTGELMSFISYMTQILMALMGLSRMFMIFSRSRASTKRILEVMDTKVDIIDGPNEGLHVRHGRVEFEHVGFSYNKGAEDAVLSDISFTAQAGQVLAIVGSTGSGKTSLVSLIARLYDADSGRVLIDGHDVREYTLENLREGIGMVMQRNTLFSGSIKENIQWGGPDASMDEIEQAAKAAQAHGFIMDMEQGYDTVLGQGGVNLSGGQRQRLCIARAMAKKPRILILDDSTSAVDSATEARIKEAFHTSLKDTTTFIIAQKISSVREADTIIVLDKGRIAGIGDHDTLLRSNNIYKEINDSQQEEVKN